jgi:predicted enzyme related to lactoylglutathione lyase
MGNPVVRWQIICADPDSTVSFYRQLFGWTDTRDNALGYRQVDTGSNGIDGGVWPGPPQVQPFVQLFIEVPDVARHIERATRLGAQVIVPDSVLPDGDRMAVLRDPAGLSFAICSSVKVEA